MEVGILITLVHPISSVPLCPISYQSFLPLLVKTWVPFTLTLVSVSSNVWSECVFPFLHFYKVRLHFTLVFGKWLRGFWFAFMLSRDQIFSLSNDANYFLGDERKKHNINVLSAQVIELSTTATKQTCWQIRILSPLFYRGKFVE